MADLPSSLSLNHKTSVFSRHRAPTHSHVQGLPNRNQSQVQYHRCHQSPNHVDPHLPLQRGNEARRHLLLLLLHRPLRVRQEFNPYHGLAIPPSSTHPLGTLAALLVGLVCRVRAAYNAICRSCGSYADETELRRSPLLTFALVLSLVVYPGRKRRR
jgi:hypothetical protein